MPTTKSALTLLCAALAAATASAQQSQSQGQSDSAAKPANEQVIVPQIDRRDVKLPRFPSNDFEAGVFVGRYATQNFGSANVKGLRLGYHVTEDVFFEGAYGRSKASDELFRQILPGGIFVNGTEPLTYYNLSVGFNVLPGEAFFGRNTAKASAAYLIAGLGSTKFDQQRRQTINLGFGIRLFIKDWVAVQADVRDHIFSLDLLGKRKSTQNPEITGGLMFFF
jgi:outer membrane beta-barrel protein